MSDSQWETLLYFLNFLKKKKGSWQNEDFVQGKKQKQKTQDRGVCPQHYIKAASDSTQCAACEGAPPNHVLLGALSVQRSKGALSPPLNASKALGRAAQRAVPGDQQLPLDASRPRPACWSPSIALLRAVFVLLPSHHLSSWIYHPGLQLTLPTRAALKGQRN